MERKERSINYEILRIVLMLFIMLHHFIINADTNLNLSSIQSSTELSFIKFCILSLIECFCVIGVNGYFLLSGYFHKQPSLKKILIIVLDFYICSGFIRILGMILGYCTISYSFIKSLVYPFGEYWYMTVYVALLCATPFLNMIIEKMNRTQWLSFIIVTIFICGVWDMVFTTPFGINGGYSLISACCLYVIGGGLSKFKFSTNKHLFIFIITSAANWMLSILCYVLLQKGEWAWQLYMYNNPLVVLSSVAFFSIFVNMKLNVGERWKNAILHISKSNLGVYYIHTCMWIAILLYKPIGIISNCNFGLALVVLIPYVLFYYLMCNRMYFLIQKIDNKFIGWLAFEISEIINKIIRYMVQKA